MLSPFCRTSKNFKLFSGLHAQNLYFANGYTSNVSVVRPGSKLSFSNRSSGMTRAALVSGEGDLLAYANGNNILENSTLLGDQPVGIEMQPDAVSFGALSADTAPTSTGFPADNDEFDLDRPTAGFASVPEAIEDIRQGKVGYFLCILLF